MNDQTHPEPQDIPIGAPPGCATKPTRWVPVDRYFPRGSAVDQVVPGVDLFSTPAVRHPFLGSDDAVVAQPFDLIRSNATELAE